MSNLRKCNSLVKPAISVIRNISTTCAINNKGPFDDIPPEFVKPYVEKEETTSVKRARLLYQSRKRGMLENGLLLSTFAKKYLDGFNENLLHQYDCLINIPSNDWDIFYWAAGVKPVPTEFDNEVMNLLKDHLKNDDRESRIVQPNLY